jgi:hypothetical protein
MSKQNVCRALLISAILTISVPPSVMAHHRHHSGFRVGIFFHSYAGHYPHGHHFHIHGSHCPVVVEKHVYYIYSTPIWYVYHDIRDASSPRAFLHIVITPRHGDLYIDGYYVGQVRRFRQGRVQLPVTPGVHVVRWDLGSTAYTRQIHVQAGSTTLVKVRFKP